MGEEGWRGEEGVGASSTQAVPRPRDLDPRSRTGPATIPGSTAPSASVLGSGALRRRPRSASALRAPRLRLDQLVPACVSSPVPRPHQRRPHRAIIRTRVPAARPSQPPARATRSRCRARAPLEATARAAHGAAGIIASAAIARVEFGRGRQPPGGDARGKGKRGRRPPARSRTLSPDGDPPRPPPVCAGTCASTSRPWAAPPVAARRTELWRALGARVPADEGIRPRADRRRIDGRRRASMRRGRGPGERSMGRAPHVIRRPRRKARRLRRTRAPEAGTGHPSGLLARRSADGALESGRPGRTGGEWTARAQPGASQLDLTSSASREPCVCSCHRRTSRRAVRK